MREIKSHRTQSTRAPRLHPFSAATARAAAEMSVPATNAARFQLQGDAMAPDPQPASTTALCARGQRRARFQLPARSRGAN